MSSDIPEALRQEIYVRDKHRCRWCGRTNPGWGGYHLHHVSYRSSGGIHAAWNLILLCFRCHKYVHEHVPKEQGQLILFDLIETPGQTGLALWRKIRKTEDHPFPPVEDGKVRRRIR